MMQCALAHAGAVIFCRLIIALHMVFWVACLYRGCLCGGVVFITDIP